MSRIESQAAAVFFADLLLPLRRARMRHGSTYLDWGTRRESYWSPIISRTGGMEQLSATQCSFSAALALLEKYWSEQNERDLLQLISHLDRLYRDLTAADLQQESAPTPPEFVYPLF
jgi:hypothetical protein